MAPGSTPARSAVRGLVLVALACAAAVAVLALLVETGLTRATDVAIIDAVRSAQLQAPLAFLRPLTEVGSTPWIIAMGLVVLLLEMAAHRPWLGIAAAGTIGFASVLNSTVKFGVGRARPDLLPPLVTERGYSFPSGHSALSTVAYGILALLVIHSDLPRSLKRAIVAALVVLILLVGLSRVYLGVHYPSDVLGGWLSGTAIVLLFEALVRSRLSPRISREARTAPGGEAAVADPAAPRSGPPAPE